MCMSASATQIAPVYEFTEREKLFTQPVPKDTQSASRSGCTEMVAGMDTRIGQRKFKVAFQIDRET